MTGTGRSSRLRRKGRSSDDRGSMAILMMVVIVGMMLSALMVPMVITANRNSRFDQTRVQALNAAQAGIDVTLGAIRDAVTTSGGVSIGLSSKLPCGPISGTANSAGIASYSVVVEYFKFGLDPVKEPYPSLNRMQCVQGYGTFDTYTGATTPGYARFTSIGTVGAATNGSTAGRTLTSTYVFRVSDLNILGGLVQINGSAFCMDVGTGTPVAGAAVVLQTCSPTASPLPQQIFAYRTNLTLQLLSSITASNPNGLCVDSTDTPGTPALKDATLRLAQCGPLARPVAAYTQQWSYNDNGAYQAAQANSATAGNLPNLCMNVSSQAAGQPIFLTGASGDGTNQDPCSSGAGWVPSPSVGPGAAAVPQWINFSEFGRCLDVTNQVVGSTYLIDYPCKQNPYSAAVRWNQKFQAPSFTTGQPSVTGQIITNNGAPYCLTSPASALGYVTVTTCKDPLVPSVELAAQTWTLYSGDNSLNYSTKYTIVNGTGLCLGLGALTDLYNTWSKIDVETCNGSTEQKWNAVPSVLIAALKNFHEK